MRIEHVEPVPYTGSHSQYEVWHAAWMGAILNMDQQSWASFKERIKRGFFRTDQDSQISRLGQRRDERSYVFSAAAERIMNNCRQWKSTSLKNMQVSLLNYLVLY